MEMKKVTSLLFRGPRPKDLRVLKANGIDTIIILQSGIWELFTNDLYERQAPPDFNIKAYYLKCSDIWWPSAWAVKRSLEIIQRETSNGRKVYVHCMSGVDRTGFICASYRMMVQGWDFAKAHAEWVSEGRHVWYFWWKRALKKYSAKS